MKLTEPNLGFTANGGLNHYRKFSAVLGAMSAKSSILIRPAGMDPMVTSKNTTGFFGFGGRWCHSTAAAAAVADGGVGPAEMAAPPVDAMAVLVVGGRRRKLRADRRKKLRGRSPGVRSRADEAEVARLGSARVLLLQD